MIQGYVHEAFRPVAEQLEKQLAVPRAGGAAICIYHRGKSVMDAWGGVRNERDEPWAADTLAMSYSTTKGVIATIVLALVDRGVFDYDDPVARYWPEFAAAGKGRITIRHLLSHQAGLHDVRALVDRADRMLDWEFMTRRLAAARPAYEPGTRPGYHGLTFGWLVGELIRRVTQGTVNDALQSLLAVPLALDGAYIGAPPDTRHRLAQLLTAEASRPSVLRSVGSTLMRAAWGVLGIDRRDLKGALLPQGSRSLYTSEKLLDVEVPALNGVFTARSLARIYATLAEGGQLQETRHFSEQTIRRASEVQSRKLDLVVGFPMRWRLGYHAVGTSRGMLPSAFGHFGYGGSGAWADPERRLAVAMTLNRVSGTPFGDMRMARIGAAAVRCADRLHPHAAAARISA
jgi:CubicO group peptidase (beta-lactamase class C family)